MHFSLPADVYLGEEQYQKERRFFERTWIFVAHDSELTTNSVIARKVAGYPIILTKDQQSEIRCFTNI